MEKFYLLTIFFLGGCAAIPINPGAERVRLTKTEPGKECQFLGEATGHQGGGGFVSDVNQETGARNDLKNKAAKLGGNTVVVLTDRASQNIYHSQRGITLTGSVYRCPE